MIKQQLKNHLNEQSLQAVIVSYADSNHYLAGGLDDNGNHHLLTDKAGKTTTFNCLKQAEVALASLGAKKAWLEMETAYDEMIGSAVAQTCRVEVCLTK